MNEKLQRALITSLIHKSLLLSKEQKDGLLSAMPTLTLQQLSTLQQLIGSEENIVKHPKDLGIDELIDTANDDMLDELEQLITESEAALEDAEGTLASDRDQEEIDSIRSQLLS